MILPIDEINKRSIPYSDYFGIMKLNEKQLKDRIDFAKRFEEELELIYMLYSTLSDYSAIDDDLIISQLQQAYIDTMMQSAITVDDYLLEVAENYAKNFVETTREHLTLKVGQDITTFDGFAVIVAINGGVVTLEEYNSDNELIGTSEVSYTDVIKATSNGWYLSQDRLIFNAENEANTVMNYKEYTEAKSQYNYKTWYTQHDDRVRATHIPLNEQMIPIDQYFVVGNSLMKFPCDLSMNPSDDEVVNCRCSAIYS